MWWAASARVAGLADGRHAKAAQAAFGPRGAPMKIAVQALAKAAVF